MTSIDQATTPEVIYVSSSPQMIRPPLRRTDSVHPMAISLGELSDGGEDSEEFNCHFSPKFMKDAIKPQKTIKKPVAKKWRRRAKDSDDSWDPEEHAHLMIDDSDPEDDEESEEEEFDVEEHSLWEKANWLIKKMDKLTNDYVDMQNILIRALEDNPRATAGEHLDRDFAEEYIPLLAQIIDRHNKLGLSFIIGDFFGINRQLSQESRREIEFYANEEMEDISPNQNENQ